MVTAELSSSTALKHTSSKEDYMSSWEHFPSAAELDPILEISSKTSTFGAFEEMEFEREPSLRESVERTLEGGDNWRKPSPAVVDTKVAYPDHFAQRKMLEASRANARSTSTEDSQTAALAGISGSKKKRASILRHGKIFMKKRNSRAKVLEGIGTSAPSNPQKHVRRSNSKETEDREGKMASPLSQLSDPSGIGSAKSGEEWDSESTGSYYTYDSNDDSHSTFGSSRKGKESLGILGSLMATSERALGTLAQTIDQFFEETSDESDDETRTFGSSSEVVSTHQVSPLSKSRARTKNSRDVSQTVSSTTGTAQPKRLESPRIKSSMKKKVLLAPVPRSGMAESLGEKTVFPNIERNRSEEEIAAETMVMAVESWFGNRPDHECTPSKVTFASVETAEHLVKAGTSKALSNAIESTVQLPPKPAKVASKRVPEEENDEGAAKPAKLLNNLRKDTFSCTGDGKSFPSQNINISTGKQEKESKTIFWTDVSKSEIPQEKSSTENQVSENTKAAKPNSIKAKGGPVTSSAENQPSRVHRSASRSPFMRGRKMRQSLGDAWKSHRSSSKDKRVSQDGATPGKKSAMSAESKKGEIGQKGSTAKQAEPAIPQSTSAWTKQNKATWHTQADKCASSNCKHDNQAKKQLESQMTSLKPWNDTESNSKTTKTPLSTQEGSKDSSPNRQASEAGNASTHLSINQIGAAEDAEFLESLRILGTNTPSTKDHKNRVPGSSAHPRATQARGRSPGPKESKSQATKKTGLLAAIRRRGKNLLNGNDLKSKDITEEALKTKIIMTTNERSMSPGNTPETSPDTSYDEDSTIIESNPDEFRSYSPILVEEEPTGLFCADITSALSSRCSNACMIRLEEPGPQQQLCYSSYFPELQGEETVDPFLMGIQGQVEALVAGLTGPIDRSLIDAASAEEPTGYSLCRDSAATNEIGFCAQLGVDQVKVEDPLVSSKRDMKNFIETYGEDLKSKIGQTFSLELFEETIAKASKDWSDIAEKVTLTEPRLTAGEAVAPSAEKSNSKTFGTAPNSSERVSKVAIAPETKMPENIKPKESKVTPTKSKDLAPTHPPKSASTERPKTKAEGGDSPRAKTASNEASLPKPMQSGMDRSPKDLLLSKDEKQDSSNWVAFEGGLVFHEPVYTHTRARENVRKEEGKVAATGPSRKKKDLLYPVQTIDWNQKKEVRQFKSFTC